ncbi:hypothetical protein LCGC14_1443290, partial [marine sediment metagenome]
IMVFVKDVIWKMNNKITLKDIRKAINLLNANDNVNTEDNIKSYK